jgi:hypothetical protein
MKKKDVLRIYNALDFILNEHRGIDDSILAYTFAKNKRMISDEAEALLQAGAPDKKFIQYQTEFAMANAKLKGDELNLKVAELRELFKDTLDNREKQIDNYKELENQDIPEPKFIKVKLSQIPKVIAFMADQIFELIQE